MKKTLATLLLIFSCGSFAQESFFPTGQTLWDWYTKENNDFDVLVLKQGLYGGYVLGVFHTTFSARLHCAPVGVTHEQLREVVKNYLTNHPEDWTQQGYILTLKAFAQAYPCTQTDRQKSN